ncbi:hypothetical protein GRS48_02625 [Halorubrum sp. JWXQ-INN 858]|uniref:DUF5807 family protein n=1 Tax=Halorubrum sp. JWXQ-INN 858 TaxID=2690782 RepID=UPI0013595320|nr:DUF5807 family protein [Halorubrum sp. JWXQ-INN 858]MWV63722.1 hypothetical protein [Halorubrum sp. JWXQ-INN 858]
MSKLDEFLAGDRLEDVVLFISDAFLDDDSRLRNVGEETDRGVRLILDGETGRSAFQAGTGMGAMEFAQTATRTEGRIARSLDDGECPFVDAEDATEEAEEGAEVDAEDAESDPGDAESDAEGDAFAGDHEVRFVFAFAEGQNEEVGGIYAEGDVVHAYAHCACGESYSHKWVVGDRA